MTFSSQLQTHLVASHLKLYSGLKTNVIFAVYIHSFSPVTYLDVRSTGRHWRLFSILIFTSGFQTKMNYKSNEYVKVNEWFLFPALSNLFLLFFHLRLERKKRGELLHKSQYNNSPTLNKTICFNRHTRSRDGKENQDWRDS